MIVDNAVDNQHLVGGKSTGIRVSALVATCVFFHPAQFFAGVPAAIMTPARRTKEVFDFFQECYVFSPEIFVEYLPLVKNNSHWPLILQGGCQSIADWFIVTGRQFLLKAAKQLVPNDQEHTHILVQVRRI